jgi:glycine C-acetyltransferase
MEETSLNIWKTETEEISAAGLWKSERIIASPQGAVITVQDGDRTREVLNFCANNYLGLSSHPDLIAAARDGLGERGFGMSSVRFICGTQDAHKALERDIAAFFGFEDAVLYGSCFDANGGLFETLLGPEDAIISDALNHASIIDGVRLCKAQRYRYASGDMTELKHRLEEASGARIRMIATDGVFSMDGTLAPLDRICTLAEEHGAVVMVDDSHASGFVGATGRGTPEHFGVMGRVGILTSTLGKALGGASGGFTAASSTVTDLLRQRSRPYLFSNALAPPIVAAGIAALRLLDTSSELRDRLTANTRRFRSRMTDAGFDIIPSDHPIVPVMLGDARLAASIAEDLLAEGIYVVGFSYPVVPRGAARIRVQLSAVHEEEHVDRAVEAFKRVGGRHGVI